MIKISLTAFCFLSISIFGSIGFAKKIPCQKQAETIAIRETKKKGNFPDYLNSPSHPTEMDGKSVVVYIGARAGYNYFKMRFNKKCKLIKIEDVEYAN